MSKFFFTPSTERRIASLAVDSFYILRDGRLVTDVSTLDYGQFVEVVPRARGGKGGFGALLKSFRISKSSNIQMSRDLTGRRMRDVMEEKRLKEWIDKRADRETEKEQKKKEKYEKLKRGQPKHDFSDVAYMSQSSAILDKTEDALEAVFGTASGSNPRPLASSSSSDSEIGSDDSDIEAYLPDILAGNSTNLKMKRKNPPPVVEEPAKKMCFNTQWEQDKVHVKQPEENVVVEPTETVGTKKEAVAVALVFADDLKKPAEEEQPELEVPAVKKKQKTAPTAVAVDPKDFEEVQLKPLKDVAELESLSAEHLKAECMRHGLKCGGSSAERASRLWAIRGLKPKKYPKKLLAGK